MNAVIEDPNKNVTELRTPGPGERLHAARVSAGLEISKVAAQLHLDDAIVHALERDDYQSMPGRVFIRGYLRNYARLVGVPPESVLKQFDEHLPDELQDRQLNRIGFSVAREVRGNQSAVRLVTWLILTVVFGALVAWSIGYLGWSWQQTSTETVSREHEEPTKSLTLPGTDNQLILPERSTVAATDRAPVAVEPGQDTPDERRPSDVTQSATSTGIRRPPIQAASGQQLLTLSPAAAGVRKIPETTALRPRSEEPILAQQPSPPANVAAAVTQPGIVLQFDGPCWVDVRDAKRKFKLFGEMPKGARKVLGGVPPYDLVLGNASVVRIAIDGVPYDVTRHARGNVARFVLDPSSN